MLNENMECTCKCECKPANNCALQGELLQKIRCYAFAVNDIALYLDTHPTDSKALCLHRKYCQELKDLEDKYQRVYGPLTINYPCNKWRWLEEPWRSFILGFFIMHKKNNLHVQLMEIIFLFFYFISNSA